MCSLSARAVKLLLAKTTVNNVETAVYLHKNYNYTLTLSNVPTPVGDSG